MVLLILYCIGLHLLHVDKFYIWINTGPAKDMPTVTNHNNVDGAKLDTAGFTNTRNIEIIKEKENQAQLRLINIKIDSINSYFKKQINKVKKLEQKVSQEDVKRKRIGEIENLKSQRDKKLEELEEQKNVKSSFEILGVMEIR